LVNLMTSQNFSFDSAEWWHYTYEKEPFPDTYFDFPIRKCSSRPSDQDL
jgi:zinc D-Ala-D-Ala dipeptidase